MQEDIESLRARIESNPEDFEAVELYAMALSDTGENEEALKNFIYLKNNCPDNPAVYYNIGIILEKLKKNREAVSAYKKAHALDSANTDYMFNLAAALIKENRLDEAEDLLLKVIETDTEDENSYFHLGEIYTRKKDHDNAVKYLSKAVELDSSDNVAKFYLAHQYKEKGDAETAIKLYNEVIEQDSGYSWAYFNLASIYLEAGDDEKAVFYLNNTIRTNPMDLKALKMLVKLLCRQNNYPEAYNIVMQKLKELPEEADLYYLAAGISRQAGDLNKCLDFLLKTREKAQSFTGSEEMLDKEISEIETASAPFDEADAQGQQ